MYAVAIPLADGLALDLNQSEALSECPGPLLLQTAVALSPHQPHP